MFLAKINLIQVIEMMFIKSWHPIAVVIRPQDVNGWILDIFVPCFSVGCIRGILVSAGYFHFTDHCCWNFWASNWCMNCKILRLLPGCHTIQSNQTIDDDILRKFQSDRRRHRRRPYPWFRRWLHIGNIIIHSNESVRSFVEQRPHHKNY